MCGQPKMHLVLAANIIEDAGAKMRDVLAGVGRIVWLRVGGRSDDWCW